MSRYDKDPDEAALDDRAQSAIEIISGLYPPDSEYNDTEKLGRGDLIDALCAEWRPVQTSVGTYLIWYLCYLGWLQHCVTRQSGIRGPLQTWMNSVT